MKYPKRSVGALREKTLPQFSLGINTRDGDNMHDSSLKSALNVWYSGGVLQTRPAFSYLTQQEFMSTGKVISTDTKTHSRITDGSYTLVSSSVVSSVESMKGDQTDLTSDEQSQEYETVIMQTVNFMWLNSLDTKLLPSITFSLENENAIGYFVCEHRGVLYCFFRNHIIYRIDPQKDNGWARVTTQDMYAPLMYVGGTPNGSGKIDFSLFEGRNILSPYYRMRFSALNPQTEQSQLLWQLPHKLPQNLKGVITATYTDTSGNTTTHTVNLKSGGSEFFQNEKAGPLYLFVKSDSTFGFSQSPDSTTPATLPLGEYLADNITLTATTDIDESIAERVYKSRVVCSFSGTSLVARGSSRLFLGGDDGILLYSGLDNPLYFPENCYQRVGDASKPITALSRFEDKLIIFKSHEIYYTYYASDTSITAEDILDSSELDYTALSVYFPLVCLNSSIGCDCPDTVLLCRNRLVFTHSSGKIYTLTGTNQYSAMQVYLLSDTADEKLSALPGEDLKGATAVCYDGYYVLCCGQRLFALMYLSHGFVNISSFSNNSRPVVPIFEWQLPQNYCGFLAPSGILALLPTIQDGTLKILVAKTKKGIGDDLSLDGQTVKSRAINSFIETKNYSLGTAGYRKTINRVVFNMSCSDEVVVRFMGEKSQSESRIYPAKEISSQIFLNPIGQTARLCLKLQSRGAWELDSISIIYKTSGGGY